MSRIRTYLLVVTASLLAGMIGAAFGTGTAQAVVSTLVSVVNPTTSPVQTSSVNVTDPGRIAYQSQVSLSKCGTERLSCQLVFPAVPTGHRLVVQHISATDSFNNPGTTFLRASVRFGANINTAFVTIEAFSPPFSASTVQGGYYAFDQPVLFYIDPGNVFVLLLESDGSFAGFGSLTLTGYELDCTVAACAPIATQ